MRDPRKPSNIKIECKGCGAASVDNDPRWRKQTGKYIAKTKRCKRGNCMGRVMIPQNISIKWVTYNAVMVGISRVGKPYFRSFSRHSAIPSYKESSDGLDLCKHKQSKQTRAVSSSVGSAQPEPHSSGQAPR